jgi:hypothetical protein
MEISKLQVACALRAQRRICFLRYGERKLLLKHLTPVFCRSNACPRKNFKPSANDFRNFKIMWFRVYVSLCVFLEHSLTHSHALTHSRTHAFTHSRTHALTHFRTSLFPCFSPFCRFSVSFFPATRLLFFISSNRFQDRGISFWQGDRLFPCVWGRMSACLKRD